MYVVTGATGKVGGAAARALLEHGLPVRVIVRDPDKGAHWKSRGADVAIVAFDDERGLTAAFEGASGVFLMLPPNFAPDPELSDARAISARFVRAVRKAEAGKVVALSAIGAQHSRDLGVIGQLHLLEQTLAQLETPTAFVRAAWFMENFAPDITQARKTGLFRSFLQPLDTPRPMVATGDIGRTIAQTLHENWTGRRIIEVGGPSAYSPLDVANALTKVARREVRAEAVPREAWAEIFAGQGSSPSGPRIAMIDGFNSGWIAFEGKGVDQILGKVTLDEALEALADRVLWDGQRAGAMA
jgi:NAD(P)H dehydrogenase (quinone)